jgi:hypothetical protein
MLIVADSYQWGDEHVTSMKLYAGGGKKIACFC